MFKSNLIFRIIMPAAFALLCALPAFSQIWIKIGGINDYVNKIYLPASDPARIVVASDGTGTDLTQETVAFPIVGNGVQMSSDSGKNFTRNVLSGISVYDFIQSPSNYKIWFASIRKLTYGGISKSEDDGMTWQETPPFLCTGSFQAISFAVKPGSPEIFYGAAVNNGTKGLIYTDDFFDNCFASDTMNIQARHIAVSPLDNNLMFLAGDNFYFGGVLRSFDGGLTWMKSESGLDGLRVLFVLASGRDKSMVFCSADSVLSNKTSKGKGIFRSLDTGRTWQSVGVYGPINSQVFEMAQHPMDPKHLVAAAGDKGVYISSNFGWSWLPFNDGLPEGSSVRTVAIPDWDINEEGFIIFAGTYGNGLYKSTRVYNSVEDMKDAIPEELEITAISPQPFIDRVNIEWKNPSACFIGFQIFDFLGRLVYSSDREFFDEGLHSFSWIPDASLNSGTYFLSIGNGLNTVAKKIIMIKEN